MRGSPYRMQMPACSGSTSTTLARVDSRESCADYDQLNPQAKSRTGKTREGLLAVQHGVLLVNAEFPACARRNQCIHVKRHVSTLQQEPCKPALRTEDPGPESSARRARPSRAPAGIRITGGLAWPPRS